jgi:hypothetical protein
VQYFIRNKNFIKRYSSKEDIENLIQILNKIMNDKFITEKNKQFLKNFIEDI